MVYPTDKSSKLAVCTFESYEAQGAVHTKGDKVVDWADVTKAQREVKGHLFTLNNVFSTGKDLGDKAETRAREAKQMASLVIPRVYLMNKDHKPCDSEGNPKTRPVCTASETMNMEMSEWVTKILDSAMEAPVLHEVISTEEMLAKIDETN